MLVSDNNNPKENRRLQTQPKERKLQDTREIPNIIETWKKGVSVFDFFNSMNETAEIGRLGSKDKVRLARQQLRNITKSC